MLIVRFRAGDATRYGALEGPVVLEYSGTPWNGFRRGRKRHPLHQVVLLAPVAVAFATGTPAGADRLLPGDRVEVRVEGVGSLKNPVVKL